MKILEKKNETCHICFEKHEIWKVIIKENTQYKNTDIQFDAQYYYCPQTEEYYEDEELIRKNQLSLIDEYRKINHLLTSFDMISIRETYQISQKDLSKLFGFSPSTITRYENYQVQNKAHDELLRKLSNDPEWFLELLIKEKNSFSPQLYKKYFKVAHQLIDIKASKNTKNQILQYYKNIDTAKYCGNKKLDLTKVVDMINYLSQQVENLHKVKLMKLMWYCDSLYYKHYHTTITGLAYMAETWGALPVCHNEIILLPSVTFKEIEYEQGIGFQFSFTPHYKISLNQKEKEIIDKVIEKCGHLSRIELVEMMHNEDAYKYTLSKDLIDFSLVETLSIDL